MSYATFFSRVRPSAWRALLVTSCQALQTSSVQPATLRAVRPSEPHTRSKFPTTPTTRRYYGDSSTDVSYTDEYFKSLTESKPLVVFMKGEPSDPMCGFSRLVIQILHMHGLDDYQTYDVLEDVNFKEGMKKFSNWPTFPQVYLKGELFGGADIMLQMHQSGELIPELERIGHRSILLDQETSS